MTARARAGIASNYGVYNASNSTPTIRNSSITGTQNSIFNDSSSALVVATELDGDPTSSGFTCVGAYDAGGALNATCT
ncbi:MAG: hypothetical protein GKR86_16415 [Ilumatobacter sp.]|nr:hypothetical protein [Ilumatobacter sp.]